MGRFGCPGAATHRRRCRGGAHRSHDPPASSAGFGDLARYHRPLWGTASPTRRKTMSGKRLRFAVAGAITALTALPKTAQAQSAEDFFKSTTLTMVVASGAGGGYDATARTVARHMSRFLPGNPTIVIKNMPGAAGLTGAHHISNNAPKDGSTTLAAANAPLMLPIYDSKIARFDPRKLEWIGSTDKQQAVCLTWHTSPIKTLADATKREVPVAATGVAAGPGIYPKILDALFGTKFKVIAGADTGGS